MGFTHTNLLKSLSANSNFLTRFLIDRKHNCQPIRSHVRTLWSTDSEPSMSIPAGVIHKKSSGFHFLAGLRYVSRQGLEVMDYYVGKILLNNTLSHGTIYRAYKHTGIISHQWRHAHKWYEVLQRVSEIQKWNCKTTRKLLYPNLDRNWVNVNPCKSLEGIITQYRACAKPIRDVVTK